MGNLLSDRDSEKTLQKQSLLPLYVQTYSTCLRSYHCLIYGEISGKSLPELAVFVHPLDLRLGLFLGFEHSRHAWPPRFVLAHS